MGYHCRLITACGAVRDFIRESFDEVLLVPLVIPIVKKDGGPLGKKERAKYRTFVFWGSVARRGIKRQTYVYYEVPD